MLNCTFVNFILQNCQKRVLKRYKLGKNAQNCMLKIVNHKFQNKKFFRVAHGLCAMPIFAPLQPLKLLSC